MEKKTTIYDIARELDVTVSTVSRALNNNPAISEETRKSVIDMAHKLNYRPNKIASSLSSGKTNIIGIVVPSAKIQFFSSVIHSLEQSLKKSGYNILLYQTNESYKSEIDGVETLLAAQVDGIIISLSLETNDISHIEKIKKEGKPVIVFDRLHNDLDVPTVSINDKKAGYLVTKHLIDSGYKHIAYITTKHKIPIFEQRVAGYKEALEEANLPIRKEWILMDDMSILGGIAGVEKLFSAANKPDAIIAGDDFTALGIMRALHQINITPPQVGVIGFANQTFSAYITPSLSTVDQQAIQMGQECANLFLKIVGKKNKQFGREKIVLDPILIARESTKK